MSLVEELNAKTLVLWSRNKLTLVRIDVKILTGINESKITRSLDDKEYNILDIEDEWRSPVHDVVNIALGCSAYN